MTTSRLAHFQGIGVVTELVRDDELGGRPHLVVPAVLVREMVLGSNGDGEYLPRTAITDSVQFGLWNGKPVTLDHPVKNGRFTLLGDLSPAEVEKIEVGRLWNVREASGKLKGEIWVDVELAERTERGQELVRRLEAHRDGNANGGQLIEGSTGYLAKVESKDGTFDSVPYSHVTRELVPDHFAVLLDSKGKCSVEDGCGLPRVNVRASARTPTFSDTSEGTWSAPTLADNVRGLELEFEGERPTVEGLSAEAKRRIAALTLLGDPGADNVRDLMFFQVVEPGTGRLNRNALNAVRSIARGGRGGANIPQAAADSAFRKAGDLLRDEFDADIEEEEASMQSKANEGLVRQVLSRIGEMVRKATGDQEPEPTGNASFEAIKESLQDVLRDEFGDENTFVWVEDIADDGTVVYTVQEEGKADRLFAAPYTFNEDTLAADVDFGAAEEVVKRVEYTPVGAGETEDEPMDETIETLVAIEGFPLTLEQLNELDEERIDKLAQAWGINAEGEGDAEPPPDSASAEPEGDEGDAEPAANVASDNGSGECPDVEQFVNALGCESTDEATRILAVGREELDRREAERQKLAKELAANEDCQFSAERLNAMSLEDLQALAGSIRTPVYLGQGGPRSAVNREQRRASTPPIVTAKPTDN